MEFSDFDLDERLLRGVADMGFVEPTAIQEDAIPPAVAGRDVLGAAMTGSGKTAAYVLPTLNRLLRRERGSIGALVLAPTRELAQQVESHLTGFAAHTDLTSAVVHGGVAYEPQEAAFRRGVDVLIATPGRLLDHLRRPYARLDSVEVLILDEADRMLDMGFIPDVRKILREVPEKRQTLLFSATMPQPIVALSREILDDPATINIERKAMPATGITQAVYPVRHDRKFALFHHLLVHGGIGSALAFVRTKERADHLAAYLAKQGVSVAAIHGNRTQIQRTKALEAFRRGEYQALVATDVAARGLDLVDLTHVVNIDVPAQPEDYIHRVGRTARYEAKGDAFTFVAARELADLHLIEKVIGAKIPRLYAEGFDYRPAAERLEAAARPAKTEASKAEAVVEPGVVAETVSVAPPEFAAAGGSVAEPEVAAEAASASEAEVGVKAEVVAEPEVAVEDEEMSKPEVAGETESVAEPEGAAETESIAEAEAGAGGEAAAASDAEAPPAGEESEAAAESRAGSGRRRRRGRRGRRRAGEEAAPAAAGAEAAAEAVEAEAEADAEADAEDEPESQPAPPPPKRGKEKGRAAGEAPPATIEKRLPVRPPKRTGKPRAGSMGPWWEAPTRESEDELTGGAVSAAEAVAAAGEEFDDFEGFDETDELWNRVNAAPPTSPLLQGGRKDEQGQRGGRRGRQRERPPRRAATDRPARDPNVGERGRQGGQRGRGGRRPGGEERVRRGRSDRPAPPRSAEPRRDAAGPSPKREPERARPEPAADSPAGRFRELRSARSANDRLTAGAPPWPSGALPASAPPAGRSGEPAAAARGQRAEPGSGRTEERPAEAGAGRNEERSSGPGGGRPAERSAGRAAVAARAGEAAGDSSPGRGPRRSAGAPAAAADSPVARFQELRAARPADRLVGPLPAAAADAEAGGRGGGGRAAGESASGGRGGRGRHRARGRRGPRGRDRS